MKDPLARPSVQMTNSAPSYPGRDALFWMGVDRFNVHGGDAYMMPYPGRDIPPCWESYRMGVRAAEFGWNYDRCRKELRDKA